jgi:dolichyldiphosphatase
MWVRRIGLLDWVLDTEGARMLRMRDLVVEEDLAEAGWQKWKERRAMRERCLGNEPASKKNE